MWRRGKGRIGDSWGLHALGQDKLCDIAGKHQARSGVESNEKLVATKSNPSEKRKFPGKSSKYDLDATSRVSERYRWLFKPVTAARRQVRHYTRMIYHEAGVFGQATACDASDFPDKQKPTGLSGLLYDQSRDRDLPPRCLSYSIWYNARKSVWNGFSRRGCVNE